MNQEEKNQLKVILRTVACVTFVICLICLLFFRQDVFRGAWKVILGIMEPFIYGAVIAYLLRPIAKRIEGLLSGAEKRIFRKTHSGVLRMVSILLSLALLFLVLILMIMTVLPEVASSISGLIAQLPGALEEFQTWVASLDSGDMSHNMVGYIQETVETLTVRLQNYLQTDLLPDLMNLVSDVTTSFGNIFSVLKNFGLGCIIAAYLLGGWEKFIAQAKLVVYGIFPKEKADWIKREVLFTDRMMSGFIHGKVLDSLIVGLICFVFCSVANMPYAVLVSLIVGVTNVIPFFGPYLGAIPSILLILTSSPVKSIVFLVFVIILQQFDGNILGPKILGDKLGLSGFWILFSILVAGSLWGLPGMLLGAPLFAVIYDLVRRFLHLALHRRGEDELLSKYEETYH